MHTLWKPSSETFASRLWGLSRTRDVPRLRPPMPPAAPPFANPVYGRSRHRHRVPPRAVLGWMLMTMLAMAGGGMREAQAAEERPTVTISFLEGIRGDRFEDETIAFLLERTGDVQNALNVSVHVYDGGDMVNGADEGLRTVTFDVGDDFTVFLPRVLDDTEDEPHSTVTVVVKSAPHYRVGGSGQASARVRDNDGKLIELTVDPLERIVDEGQTAMFDLVATTVGDGTFETVGDLARVFGADTFHAGWSTRTVSEATSPDDYMVLSEQV